MSTRNGFTWIELLTGLLLVCIIAGVAIPSYVRVKEKAKESEAKSGLHEIQLGVERFATDSEGSYPAYLIGGSGPLVQALNHGASDLSDPLLRLGYLRSYPRNPFTARAAGRAQVHAVQASLPSSTVYGSDPLRPGTAESTAGLRFGSEGGLMGSVLADARYREYSLPQLNYALIVAPDREPVMRPTYADVEYDYWDMFAPVHHKAFLPGEFFYKSVAPIIKPAVSSGLLKPIAPEQNSSYVLGAFGGLRTSGNDVLGEEVPFVWPHEVAKGKFEDIKFWSWTRSQVQGPGDLQGNPIWHSDEGNAPNESCQYANPNGIRDGVVLTVISCP